MAKSTEIKEAMADSIFIYLMYLFGTILPYQQVYLNVKNKLPLIRQKGVEETLVGQQNMNEVPIELDDISLHTSLKKKDYLVGLIINTLGFICIMIIVFIFFFMMVSRRKSVFGKNKDKTDKTNLAWAVLFLEIVFISIGVASFLLLLRLGAPNTFEYIYPAWDKTPYVVLPIIFLVHFLLYGILYQSIDNEVRDKLRTFSLKTYTSLLVCIVFYMILHALVGSAAMHYTTAFGMSALAIGLAGSISYPIQRFGLKLK